MGKVYDSLVSQFNWNGNWKFILARKLRFYLIMLNIVFTKWKLFNIRIWKWRAWYYILLFVNGFGFRDTCLKLRQKNWEFNVSALYQECQRGLNPGSIFFALMGSTKPVWEHFYYFKYCPGTFKLIYSSDYISLNIYEKNWKFLYYYRDDVIIIYETLIFSMASGWYVHCEWSKPTYFWKHFDSGLVEMRTRYTATYIYTSDRPAGDV